MPQDPTDPTGVSSNTAVVQQSTKTARQRKADSAIQLKIAGSTYDEIAEVLGYPSGRDVLLAIEKSLQNDLVNDPKSRDRMRTLAGLRLERLIRAVWAKALDPKNPDQLTAINRAKDIIAQHSKLYGLEAATELVVHSPTKDALEQWVSLVMDDKVSDLEEADLFELEEAKDYDEDDL